MTPDPPAPPAPPTTPARPSITLIAAVARNGTIGADGGLPWHLPADLKRFKALTMGHPMIMGRRTYDSIGRALPGRRTIVVTRDAGWSAPGVTVAHSVDEAVDLALDGSDGRAPDHAPVLVVGGGDIYRQTIGRADRLELTHVDADVPGDTRFPDIDPARWQEADREDADGYAFVSYVRREPVRDLRILLVTMAPVLHDGEYRFCTVRAGVDVPAGLHPVATVAEAEGLTLVLPADRGRCRRPGGLCLPLDHPDGVVSVGRGGIDRRGGHGAHPGGHLVQRDRRIPSRPSLRAGGRSGPSNVGAGHAHAHSR